MNLLEELEILLETRQPYANGNAEKCYPFVAELIQQLRAAQQNAHLTPESLASSQAVSNASVVSQSDSDTPPAQAQVA